MRQSISLASAHEPLHEVVRRGPVLAVVAHPDDESFGLGALLAEIVDGGGQARVLCFTHGEASTLGPSEDLFALRHRELHAAADELGVAEVTLCDFPDGALSAADPDALDAVVLANLHNTAALIAFEPAGVTGHPDHQAASAAAQRVASAHGLPIIEWGVTPRVADSLNAAFGSSFSALEGDDTADVVVDRRAQRLAISCHKSQSEGNAVLARRLELAGDTERIRVRWLAAIDTSDRNARERRKANERST